jgi:hypothetical protein
MHHGFDQSYCDNGLIDDGIYFAIHGSYSNNELYVMKKTGHRRELFICQVLVKKLEPRCTWYEITNNRMPFGISLGWNL